MHFLEKYYFRTLKYDLINKFRCKKIKNLPKLKKIVLSIGCTKVDIRQLSVSLLALELITNQKSLFTKRKKSNILLRIRKGHPSGCKVTLRKHNLFNFFEKTLFKSFPKLKKFNGFTFNQNIKKNAFSYELHDILDFSELENHYTFFFNLSKLNIVLVTSAGNKKELMFILSSLQFPLKIKT